MFSVNKKLLVGVGNPMRGDDSAALFLIDEIKEVIPEDWDILKIEGYPENYLDKLCKYKEVWFIDVAKGVDDIAVLDWKDVWAGSFSTHVMSLRTIAEYLIKCGVKRIKIIAIPAQDFGFLKGPADKVKNFIEKFKKNWRKYLA